MNAAKIIRTIRKKIPAFSSPCPNGCHGCCGPVVACRWELDQIGGKFINFDNVLKGGTFINLVRLPDRRWSDIMLPRSTIDEFRRAYGKSPLCQFAKDVGCSIYFKRPIICRLYGVVENLRCPYGSGPKKIMRAKDGNEILQEYIRLIKKGG